jgi:dTMP kinase
MSYQISFESDFRRNTYGGLFIALEGLDGSGKSVQIQPLTTYFEKQGKKVVFARAPRKDEGILASVNKQILQQKIKIPQQAFQYLFTADYIIQNEDIIIPALKNGDVVITDRFVGWSAVPYGSLDQHSDFTPAKGKSILAAHALLTNVYQLLIPDITFFLDIPLNTAIQRLSKKSDEKEVYEEKSSLKKIKKGYQWLIKEFPDEFTIIDAERSIAQVTNDMIKVIEKKLSILSS